MTAKFEAAVNAVKDGYLWLVAAIDDNPNTTLWVVTGLILLAILI